MHNKKIIASGLATAIVLSNMPISSIASNTTNKYEMTKMEKQKDAITSKAKKTIKANNRIAQEKTTTQLEITLNEGESLADKSNEIQDVTSLKIITNGAKQLDDADFTALANCGVRNLDLSQASAIKIPDGAFNYYYNKKIKLNTVKLPENLEEIGRQAFYQCNALREVEFNSKLKKIGEYAFGYCYNFCQEIILPNSLEELSDFSFFNTSIAGIKFGNSIRRIGNYAFNGSNDIEGTLSFPNTLEYIGNSAFEDCNKITGGLDFPESLTYIGNRAFAYCTALNGDLILRENLETIGADAFAGCNGLTGDLTLPNTLQELGAGAFNDCSGLTGELVIPKNITSIGGATFYGCKGLTGQLIIPDNITEIGYSAFAECAGFTGTVIIPNSITSILGNTFMGCTGIDTFVFGPTLEEVNTYSYYDPTLASENQDVYMQVNPNRLGPEYFNTYIKWLSWTPERVIVEMPFNLNPEGTWVDVEGYSGKVKNSSIYVKKVTTDGEADISEGDTTQEAVIRISENTDFSALSLKLNGSEITLSEDNKEYTLTQSGNYEFSRTFKNGDVETITFSIVNPYEGYEEVGVALEKALLTRTSGDLSKARTLVNAMPDSEPRKAEFQAKLNAIAIIDGGLTPGTASANVDVYIKSENMLSLSLDTNSVTFENFNGTENLEELNAVKLTVNSSLPYDVNAYLATKIENANKDKELNKDLLKIRANGTADYKGFTDVGNTATTLLSNEQAGNNKVYGIDLKLEGSDAVSADIYKTTIKFEVTQK